MKNPTLNANRGWLQKLQEERGEPVKALAEAPAVLPHAELYWDAYNTLTRTRIWAEGRPYAIPMTEVEAYCRMREWDWDDVDTLLFVFDALEEVYFAWVKRKSPKGSGKRRLGR